MAIAHNDLQRSLANMTVHFHRAVEQRKHQADRYKICEREQQFQIEISGKGEIAPVEKQMTIPFDVFFIGDAGNQRAGTLSPPQLRTGWEFSKRPTGLVVFAHVDSWTFDDALNYSGCLMTAGAHIVAPLSTATDPTDPTFNRPTIPPDTDTGFVGVLHVSFQGFGGVFDGEPGDSPDNLTS